MKINTNSNTYTILYASGVVLVVATLLATCSMVLKPTIETNERIDRKNQILSSLLLAPAHAEVESTYEAVVKSDPIVNEAGEMVSPDGGFAVVRKDIKADCLPVFICEVEGQTKYVLPLVGKGLWGTIWGYLALNDDCETVYGVYFGHESETAGLGSLIAEKPFRESFQGKKIFAEDGTPLCVLKHGSKVTSPLTQCDGISGATLTSNGVSDMLRDYLNMYKNYLSKLKK